MPHQFFQEFDIHAFHYHPNAEGVTQSVGRNSIAFVPLGVDIHHVLNACIFGGLGDNLIDYTRFELLGTTRQKQILAIGGSTVPVTVLVDPGT
jgi:hypothetical protein